MAAQAGAESLVPKTAQDGPGHRISVALVGNLRRLLAGAFLGAAVLLVVGLLLPKEYTARASFIPDAGEGAGLLGGLVGQFVGLQTDRLSPRLAGDLAEGDPLLTQVLYERFPLRGENDSVLLRDYLVGARRDSAIAELKALKRLKRDVAVDVNERTGVVDVYSTFHDPILAASVANRVVQFVDRFNNQTRQSRAGALRHFLEERTQAARSELDDAEGALQHFYTINRRFQESPKLTLDEARLRRQVDLRQQVFVSLSQQLEQARVDEVKDTPVLTWVGIAMPPAKKSAPRLSVMVVLGALLGGGIVALVVGTAAYLTWYQETDPAGYGHFHRASQSALRRTRQNS
jgi:uncharacterized protein involved in exopolysaccharide biosynthesis